MKITSTSRRRSACLWIVAIGLLTLTAQPGLKPQDKEIAKKLQGFDAYMTKTLKDWNAPGVGVGIVAGDKLVFAKGYGYRYYEKELPFTPTTLYQIASNTKLFTAVAGGLLVDQGKLTWDEPVRDSVPSHFPRRRPARIPLPGFFHAPGANRGDRLRDWKPLCSPL